MRWVFLFVLSWAIAISAQSPGDIMISEIMQNPDQVSDTNGEWFEVFNTTSSPIDINGWRIRDLGTDSHVINNGGSLTVPAKGFLVLARNSDSGLNGGFTANYQYSGFLLGNGADEIILEMPDGGSGFIEIDRVEYDGGPNWPDPTGASMVYVGPPNGDNNDFNNWTTATLREPTFVGPTGDLGSPGTNGSDQSLPVTLSSFTATAGDGKVILRWVTESEIDNVGFEVLRATEEEGDYQLLSSYMNNPDLVGQFNSNTRTRYQFVDPLVINGIPYWYKLVDVDVNGQRTEHGPISVTPNAAGNEITATGNLLPENIKMYPNFPNPFNPETTLQFDVPVFKKMPAEVSVTIYNALGQKVKTLFSGPLEAGQYQLVWRAEGENGAPVPGGVYFALLRSNSLQRITKLVLLK